MPRYKVTGGADGVSGVEIDGQRHEPGDIFECPAKLVGWLVDGGYLALAGKARPSVEESES